MPAETFLRLQPSETVVCHMASRLLAARIAAGHLAPGAAAEVQDALLDECLGLAVRLARRIDEFVDSDDESGEA